MDKRLIVIFVLICYSALAEAALFNNSCKSLTGGMFCYNSSNDGNVTLTGAKLNWSNILNAPTLSSGSDNVSWNESYARSIITGNNNTIVNYILAVNSSNPGSGDNVSWNKSYADTLYYPLFSNPYGYYNISTLPGGSGDNESWNESYAKTLFADISVVDTDTWNTSQEMFNAVNNNTFVKTNDNTKDINITSRNITDINLIRFSKIVGACDITISGSICSNTTGTYIIG